MLFLVVGLGSMGRRRIRCLHTLGYQNIIGYDLRDDRRLASNISTFNTVDECFGQNPDFVVISVPPDQHHIYIDECVKRGVPAFVEASVVDTGMEKNLESKIVYPSCTLLFHPAIMKIREILPQLGEIINVTYHSGQFLPDWHTYEHVREYYVSKKETGGAREIVPFELTWMTRVFGYPSDVVSSVRKRMEIDGAEEIDDTYNIMMLYPNFDIVLIVDVTSRRATRRLLINGSLKQLQWDWNDHQIIVTNEQETIRYDYSASPSQEGYNKNITEDMYVEELQHFVQVSLGLETPLNTLREDHRILKLLYEIEAKNVCLT